MTHILTFHLIRHGPVLNPDQIWYGREVEFDLSSPHIVSHFNQLATILPVDRKTSVWRASEYPRSLALAQFLLKASGVENPPDLVVDMGCIEQQYGEMEGTKGQEAKSDPRFAAYFADMWENPPPGGESLRMLQMRAAGTLDRLADELSPDIQDVVIVAHGGFNMAAYVHSQGLRMIDIFKSKGAEAVPSFSFISKLALQYDRDAKKWLPQPDYMKGIPKQHL